MDINDVALERCREKTDFNYEPAKGKVYIKKDDVRNLDFIPAESIGLICTHPQLLLDNFLCYSFSVCIPSCGGVCITIGIVVITSINSYRV